MSSSTRHIHKNQHNNKPPVRSVTVDLSDLLQSIQVLYPSRYYNNHNTLINATTNGSSSSSIPYSYSGSSTHKQRFSTLLLEYGERELYDWAVVASSNQIQNYDAAAAMSTSTSMSGVHALSSAGRNTSDGHGRGHGHGHGHGRGTSMRKRSAGKSKSKSNKNALLQKAMSLASYGRKRKGCGMD